MAKELPYFKFEPNQWENGNIQLCSHESQGVFINVCSMYWQRLGDLPYKLAVQKLCGGNATAIDSLCDEGIIKVIDGMICIDFLNEQLSEFENTSKTNSENARLGWQKRRKDAKPMRPHSDPNAIREEKRKEDKIKGEENRPSFDEIFKDAFDEITCDRYKMIYKEIDLGRELQLFRIKCDNDQATYYSRDASGLRTAFQYQLKSANKNGKQNGLSKSEQHAASLVKGFAERWGTDAPKTGL